MNGLLTKCCDSSQESRKFAAQQADTLSRCHHGAETKY
jgi:hypothetical protein